MLLPDKALDWAFKGSLFVGGVYVGKKLFGEDSHTSSSEVRYVEAPKRKKKKKKKK